MKICKDCAVKNEAEKYCSEEMKNICVTRQEMAMCQNCPFREEEVLYRENEEVMRICKYQAICQRAIKTTIHETCVWEDMAGNRNFSF